jgi:hypothetical protein
MHLVRFLPYADNVCHTINTVMLNPLFLQCVLARVTELSALCKHNCYNITFEVKTLCPLTRNAHNRLVAMASF